MQVRAQRLALEVFLVPWLLVAAWGLSATNHWLESRAVEAAASGDVGALPNGRALNVASLGFERLVADLFWIRTVYYVGGDEPSRAGWPAAERLANLVSDIDPHFDTVYTVMSSVLSGLGSNPDAAIRVLEKGAAVSSFWRIHFLLGFQYFVEKQDYERGAKALERAVELGGPPYLQFLVSRLYATAGDPTTAMGFIQARMKDEPDPEVRKKLAKRLSDIWVNRDLAAIDGAIATYEATEHRTPTRVAELVDAGLLAREPRDPLGGAYGISNGAATSAVEHEAIAPHSTRGPK